MDVKVRLGLTECRSIIKKNLMAVWQEGSDREKEGEALLQLAKIVKNNLFVILVT